MIKHCVYVFVVVSLFACLSVTNCTKTAERICMKFSGKVRNGPMKKWLNFGGDSFHRLKTGIVINWLRCVTLQCRACTIRRRHRNYDVITSPAHDREPRQPVMVNDVATLVRRALAEVCTGPMLLVSYTLSISSWCYSWNLSISAGFYQHSASYRGY